MATKKKTKKGAVDKDGNPVKTSFFKSKKAIIGLVVLLGAAGGGYMMLKPTKAGPPRAGVTVALDANTVNLTDGHYLKIQLAIQLVAGKGTASSFQASPAQQLIINEFSDRSADSLLASSVRQQLMTELTNKLKAAYPGAVFQVYVTQFVTQ